MQNFVEEIKRANQEEKQHFPLKQRNKEIDIRDNYYSPNGFVLGSRGTSNKDMKMSHRHVDMLLDQDPVNLL